jgi:hypothetical protein
MRPNWFTRVLGLHVEPSRRDRRSRAVARRPGLRVEGLEDRVAPAAVTWVGAGGDFNWGNPLNWSGGALPGPADDAVIDFGANNFTVVHSAGSDSVHSLLSHANLAVSGGGLLVAADSHLFGSLTLNATYGGSGNSVVDGLLTWGGALSGQGSLTANGGTTVTGGNVSGGFHYLNPAGQLASWTGSDIGVGAGSIFENAGTMELWTDADVSGSGLFHNDPTGTFAKRGGSTAPNLFYGSDFTIAHTVNDGAIRVDVGTLGLGYVATTVENHGSIVARAAAGQPKTTLWLLVNLTSSGSIDGDYVRFHGANAAVTGSFKADRTEILTSASTVTMSGTVLGLGDVAIGTYSQGGTLDLTGATFGPGATTLPSLALNGGTLITGASLSVAGPFTWGGSTLQGLAGHGSLTVLSDMTLNGTYSIRDFNLINAGHAVWTGGSVSFAGNSRFTNRTSATFDDQVDGQFGGTHPDCPTFDNQGLFVKSGGTGTTDLEMQLYNSGTVRIDSGHLFVGCGYVQTSPGPIPPIVLPPGEGPGIIIPGPTPLPPSTTPPPVFATFTETVTGVLIEQISGHTPPAPFGNPGTDYGELVVGGDVALNGSFQVQLLGGFAPSVGDRFLVIDNRGSHPIEGTFAGLPEGATITVGSYGFTISYVGGDGDDVVLTTTIVNQPPTAVAGGPYSVTYGGSLTLDGSGSSDPDNDPLTYSWTINGHAGAATGVSPTLTWSAVAALGIVPGQSYAVSVTVDDGHGHSVTSPPATLTANKANQSINPTWPTRAAATSTVTLNLTSTSGLPVTYSVTGPATFNTATNVLTVTGLGTVTVTAHQPGDSNYNAAPDISTTYSVAAASLCGTVFKDFNEDGFQDFGEAAVGGVTVQLTGTDFNGTAVSASVTTAASGYFQFPGLLPGTYAVSVPAGLAVTKIAVGLNGGPPAVVGGGTSAGGLVIAEGTTLNVVTFGLKPAAGDALHAGQTADIGFWQNRNGQALIMALNGGGKAGTTTQLGDWLAATFPHMFGAQSGHTLAGQTNAQVAAYYLQYFATRGDKVEAQVFATALSVYATSQTLAGGTYAAGYGFTVSADGTGVATVNVGGDGAAVARPNNTTMTILDILIAADANAQATAAGFALYSDSPSLRCQANELFGRINDAGGI